MDGYAHSMLDDDISSKEEIKIQCPNCHHQVPALMTDEFIRCKSCGEVFYLEALDDN